MRYTSEINLWLFGDRSKAQRYISQARLVVGELWNQDITLGGLPQAWRTVQLENGEVTIDVHIIRGLPPIVRITAGDAATSPTIIPFAYFLKARWRPEGILLTPSTDTNPDGWGLPRRNPDETGALLGGLGTPGGYWPQVLLNRFENNKYHDNPRFLQGQITDTSTISDLVDSDYEPPRTRESYEAAASAPLLFGHSYVSKPDNMVSYAEPELVDGEEELDDYVFASAAAYDLFRPGLFRGPELVLSEAEVTEPETEIWYAHWPQELLFDNLTYEYVFQSSNALRTDVGEEPAVRPLRGEGSPALLCTEQFRLSPAQVFSHSYYDWYPGLRTANGRILRTTGSNPLHFFTSNTGENIQAYTADVVPDDVNTEEELGNWLTEQWEDSPRHYNNIISFQWTAYEFFPWHTWRVRGTRGAVMDVAGGVTASFAQQWVPNLAPWGFELEEVNPDGSPSTFFAWAQVFHTRETWLPVYSFGQEFAGGEFAGTFGASCPYNRAYFVNQRRFGTNTTIYEIPEGNERPAFNTFAAPRDDFMTVLGAAPFERDGERWIRVVYWNSSEAGDSTPPTAHLDNSRWGDLVVLVFPEGLTDSARLPWRTDEMPEEWEEEYRRRFEALDGWVPEPEGAVVFNEDGTKFLLELEKAGPDLITYGFSRAERITGGGGTLPTSIADIATAQPVAQVNLQRVPFEYENGVLTELLQDREPIRALVDTGYRDSDNAKFFYNVRVIGEYEIWPHYDTAGDIQWVTLVVDEHTEQDAELALSGAVFDPLDPKIESDTGSKGYRRRLLRFPSGKEIVYMQQYMVQNFAVEFGEPPPFGYAYFPGDGLNFYAVFHYLDLQTETVIYSRHTTVTYNNYRNTDPLGTTIPDLALDSNIQPPNNFSWTRGDSTYFLDAFTGTERVEETLAQYDNAQDPVIRYQPMTAELAAGRTIFLQHGYDLYAFGTTPYTFFSEVNGPGGVYSFNTQMMIPGSSGDDVSTADFFDEEPFDGLNAFFGVMPVDDFNVSVSTRGTLVGETATGAALRLPRGERYYGQRTAGGAYWNVAPMFSTEQEVRAKFVTYRDRWVARLEVRHINRHGVRPPPAATQPRVSYSGSDYTYSTVYDGDGEATYQDTVQGMYNVNISAVSDNGTAVHITSNFDLDEALGISDVTDIEPFGRVG